MGTHKIIWSILVFIIGHLTFKSDQTTTIHHNIKVIHPGISRTDPVDCVLVETRNAHGKPISFSMKVQSVVCGDSQCRIDMVQIVWDPIGRYQRFSLAPGVALEKAKGANFTEKDYEKLHTILANATSPLKEVYKEEVVGTVGSEGIDALSGETIILDKTAYVKGAVWTCYSLWHWVHGSVQNKIRAITGKSFSLKQLTTNLKNEDKAFQYYALEQLGQRKTYTQQYTEQVRSAIKKNPALMEVGLLYFQEAPRTIFEENIVQLLNFSEAKNRELCLQRVFQYKEDLSASFLKRLIKALRSSSSFKEIHMLLTILRDRKGASQELTNDLFPFLENDNFLIARGIYWFLSEQKLTHNQKGKLHSFYVAHQHKL